MDFPAIDKTMKLKAFNLNEFCLCPADEDALPPLPPPPPPPSSTTISTRPVSVRTTYINDIQGTSQLSRKSPPPLMVIESCISDKSAPGSSGAAGALLRNDSFATVREKKEF